MPLVRKLGIVLRRFAIPLALAGVAGLLLLSLSLPELPDRPSRHAPPRRLVPTTGGRTAYARHLRVFAGW